MKLSKVVTALCAALLVAGLVLERNNAVDDARINQCQKIAKLFLGPQVAMIATVTCVIEEDQLFIKIKNIWTQEEQTYDEQGQRVK